MRALLLAATSLACFLLFGARADADTIPDGWIPYAMPADPRACEWLRANYSKREWRVRLDNASLKIEPDDRPLPLLTKAPRFSFPRTAARETHPVPRSDNRVLATDDGWLVGFDLGEWGGRLWWADKSGRNAYAVPDAGRCDGTPDTRSEYVAGNVKSLMRSGANVFVATGLAHGLDNGAFKRVERKGGKWQSCVLQDLKAAPWAVAADGSDSWYVLTRSLVRVHASGAMETILTPEFLSGGLYPNSMVKLPDGTLYVGMRHFVARMSPNAQGSFSSELLIPAGRPPFDRDEIIDAPDRWAAYTNCPRIR